MLVLLYFHFYRNSPFTGTCMANCTSIKYFERQIELFLIIRKFLNKYKIIKPLPRYLIKNQKKDDAILLKKQSQDYMYIIQLLLFLHFFFCKDNLFTSHW